MIIDDLSHVTDIDEMPAAVRILHELAVRVELPFLIAGIPREGDPGGVGLLVEVAPPYQRYVAAMLREVADKLDSGDLR